MCEYRVLTNSQGDHWVAEVYFKADGSLIGYADASAYGDSIESLRQDFLSIATALAVDPIHVDQFPCNSVALRLRSDSPTEGAI